MGDAADGEQHAQGVLHRLLGDDFGGTDRRFRHLHGTPAAGLGGAQAVGVHRRNRRRSGQRHAQRLGNRRHGGSGTHHRAGTGGGRPGGFDRFYFGGHHFSSP